MKVPIPILKISPVLLLCSSLDVNGETNQRSPKDPASSKYRDHFAEDGGIAATSGLINPSAWHREGKTYVVYQGKMNAPTITSYDHRKPKGERWAPNVKVGVNPLGNTDTHGTPSMLIDKQGYIHVFFGSHGRRQMYSRSQRPYDITEWDKMPPVSLQMTYPCGAMLDNGTMLLIGRAGRGHVSPWVELTSSDSGKTWSEERPIVDFRPHGLYGTVKSGVDEKTVHFTWSLQAKGNLLKGTSTERFSIGRGKYSYGNTVIDNRHHCFYMRRDQNGRWRNIQGEPLQTPIDMKTAYQKCLVYRGDWPLHGQFGTMGIDKHDKPHIVFLAGKMPADKAKWHTNNVDYTYKYARWDSKRWVLNNITTTDSIWDNGQAVFPEPNGSVNVYLVARGSRTDEGQLTTKGRIGGNIEQWRSEDHGKTWKKIKDVITYTKTGRRLFNCPHSVVNAHPDARVIFSTWSTDEYFQQGDFTQLVYLFGDSGFCSRRNENEKKQGVKEKNMAEFQKLSRADWKEVFLDPCTGNWRDRWTLDGLKATAANSKKGMDFKAGPVRKENAAHAVMWTKNSFTGDIRLDYEYTKTDDATEAVTILYLQATGSGADGYDKDITRWSDKRAVPAMSEYFNHMDLLHISYAAFGIGNVDAQNDYIRARRYMPETGNGLAKTDLKPDYLRTGLFAKDVPHRITVIKKGDDLFMFIRNTEKEILCRWKTDESLPITEGRIGLRHMWTRAARYRDFRVSISKKQSTNKKSTAVKTVKELTLEEKVVGEYESIYNGKTYKRVFLKNGIVEWYVNGKKRAEYKLEIVNGEIRAAFGSEYKDIYRINTDRSITHIAYIDNGEREDFPKEEQVTYKRIK